MMDNHNSKTCDLCIAGREDLCKIREKSISEFEHMNNRTGEFKDFQTIKKERIEYELKLVNIKKRTPV